MQIRFLIFAKTLGGKGWLAGKLFDFRIVGRNLLRITSIRRVLAESPSTDKGNNGGGSRGKNGEIDYFSFRYSLLLEVYHPTRLPMQQGFLHNKGSITLTHRFVGCDQLFQPLQIGCCSNFIQSLRCELVEFLKAIVFFHGICTGY